jgi:hypothetical protein
MAKYSVEKQRQFWERADDSSSSHAARGKALEELVVYLMEKIPGVSVIGTNTVSAFESEEIDVGLKNLRSSQGLSFLPTFFVVECKNWSRKVGSAEVAWFDWKVRSRGQELGILVATQGITGRSHEMSSAKEIVASALREKRQLVVITKSDIEDVAETADLVRVIEDRIGELILHRAPF